jgi:hypothetical protein
METIRCTDRVRNEVLQRFSQKKIVLQTVDRRKATWTDHLSRSDCALKHVFERKTKGSLEMTTGIRGRRRKKLLDNFKEKRLLKIEKGSIRSHCI